MQWPCQLKVNIFCISFQCSKKILRLKYTKYDKSSGDEYILKRTVME